MRALLIAGLVVGCHNDAATTDAALVNSCIGGFSQLAVPANSELFASDGTSMFVLDPNGLEKLPLAGGPPTMVAAGASGRA